VEGGLPVTTSRRAFLAGAGAAVLGAACSSDKEPSARRAVAAGSDGASQGQAFVLIHGSWHGGWCWVRVAKLLRAQGHRVFTPTQTGLGERSHLLTPGIGLGTFVTDLVHVLEWEDLTDVVLVGHSFGGVAITGAADQVPRRIRHLVYLDSLILRDGESAFSVFPPEVVASRRRLAQESSGGLSIPVPDASAFGITDPADAAWVKGRCTPHPISTYEDPMVLKNPLGNGLPVTYVAVTPEYGPTAASRTLAKEQAGWKYVELAAGHDAMVTTPNGVAEILLGV
jgi:pimeloyl-ACP methyl ester carboxylesterase